LKLSPTPPTSALPPNVVPMKGVKSQSADALVGAAALAIVMSEAAKKILRNDM
jgi:hypothetical protein